MKYIILSVLWLTTTPLFAQTQTNAKNTNENHITQAIVVAVNDSTLNSPRPSWANHDTLQNRILTEILSGNDSLLFAIINTKGFSSFMLMKNKHYTELNQPQLIKIELASTRKSFWGRSDLKPDRISVDTLLGDISRAEIWESEFLNSTKTELTVLFINHQLTNFLIRYFKKEN